MRKLFGWAFLFVWFWNIGLAATPAAKPAPPRSDRQLEMTIKEKLAKSKIKSEGFRFSVASGVVTWEGQTSVAQRKAAATRMARTAGAKAVVNNVKVSDAGRAKASEGLRRAQVKQPAGTGN